MKRWAWVVAGLYLLILVALTVPFGLLAFADIKIHDALEVYLAWGYWAWLGVMMLAQLVLLSVPVSLARGRPVSRGSLWPIVLTTGLMTALLAAGGFFALYEYVFTLKDAWGASQWLALSAVVVVTWLAWSVVFMRMAGDRPAEDWVTRQCRALFRGSILELLIAVPTHIAVRHRNECCAGCMTFMGLAAGVSVMLFSFGPAVFFLFAARWKRLQPGSQS